MCGGGACYTRDTTCLVIGLKIWVDTLLFGVHEACIAGIMAQGGLYKQETILRSVSERLLA